MSISGLLVLMSSSYRNDIPQYLHDVPVLRIVIRMGANDQATAWLTRRKTTDTKPGEAFHIKSTCPGQKDD